MIRRIVIVGAGRLATAFGTALQKTGYHIAGICNRSPERGRKLASKLGSEYFSLRDNLPEADLYIVSVADDALRNIQAWLPPVGGILAHTSGTIEIDVLKNCTEKTGVLYPPQAFTPEGPFDFENLPLCIEGDDTSIADLEKVALSLSGNVIRMNSAQRLRLHLAATIASNFPNYLYSMAQKIMKDSDLDMELIYPLIQTTARHSLSDDVFSLQTGPAIREDHTVMEKHLRILEDYPEILEIYMKLTKSIINHKHGNDKL